MARFAEPVFCSTTPFLLPQSATPTFQDGLQHVPGSHHDGMQNSIDCHDFSGADTQDHAHEDLIQGSSLQPVQETQVQCDSMPQESDERSGRLASTLPDTNLPLGTRSSSIARSRTISHQPSCDSLRNFSTTTEGRSHDGSRTFADIDVDLLPEEVRLHSGSIGQYTILTDIPETAWSVDDPRHGADVLDDLASWPTLLCSTAQHKLRDVISQRASHETCTLPVFNRQESIDSGFDVQGIAWDNYGLCRQQSLRDRAVSLSSSLSDRMLVDSEPTLDTQTERYYRFNYFNGSKRPKFFHHQLRHCLASAGRDLYYTNTSKVMQASLACPSIEDTVLDLTRSKIRITSLAATESAVIVAGGFDGEYALRDLDSPAPYSEGYVTDDRKNGTVTHIHTFAHRRSGLPQAAFSANDQCLRLMDLTTETFTKTFAYDYSLNCAVTCSDGRLRALVGDSPDPIITDAESGETLATLQSHTAHIFSCAWSPDTRTLATGDQDGKIALWDPRNWSRPLAELPNVLSCSRSLHFTADSSRLISAEDEDVVSIFDIRNLEARQDIRFFGTISGVALVDGGDEIVIANGDRSVGGLMSFRRTTYSGDYHDEQGGSLAPFGRRSKRRNARRTGVVEELIL